MLGEEGLIGMINDLWSSANGSTLRIGTSPFADGIVFQAVNEHDEAFVTFTFTSEELTAVAAAMVREANSASV